MYTTRRKNSLKIVNVMEVEEEREEVEEEVMFEEYIEEYEDDDDNRLQWNYGVEVIKNEKNWSFFNDEIMKNVYKNQEIIK